MSKACAARNSHKLHSTIWPRPLFEHTVHSTIPNNFISTLANWFYDRQMTNSARFRLTCLSRLFTLFHRPVTCSGAAPFPPLTFSTNYALHKTLLLTHPLPYTLLHISSHLYNNTLHIWSFTHFLHNFSVSFHTSPISYCPLF